MYIARKTALVIDDTRSEFNRRAKLSPRAKCAMTLTEAKINVFVSACRKALLLRIST
jgi:hypothetical protein